MSRAEHTWTHFYRLTLGVTAAHAATQLPGHLTFAQFIIAFYIGLALYDATGTRNPS